MFEIAVRWMHVRPDFPAVCRLVMDCCRVSFSGVPEDGDDRGDRVGGAVGRCGGVVPSGSAGTAPPTDRVHSLSRRYVVFGTECFRGWCFRDKCSSLRECCRPGNAGRGPRAQGWCSPSAGRYRGIATAGRFGARNRGVRRGRCFLALGIGRVRDGVRGACGSHRATSTGIAGGVRDGCATGTSGAHSGAWAGSGRDRCCAARRYGSGDSGIGGCVGIPVACASGGGARPEQGLDSCCHRRSLGRGRSSVGRSGSWLRWVRSGP